MKSLGQIAYEAYLKATDGKSLVSGQHLPCWEGQKVEIQASWEQAGKAVAAYTIDEFDKEVRKAMNFRQ